MDDRMQDGEDTHLTFSMHVAFNTLRETNFEDEVLCLRTTNSVASSHAKTSPSTVCRTVQIKLTGEPTPCTRGWLVVGRKHELTSPRVVSSLTDEPTEYAEPRSVLATMFMPVKAALSRHLAANGMIA